VTSLDPIAALFAAAYQIVTAELYCMVSSLEASRRARKHDTPEFTFPQLIADAGRGIVLKPAHDCMRAASGGNDMPVTYSLTISPELG
jgi:hypothetical protein